MMNLVFKLIIFKILNSLLKVFKLSLNKLSVIRIRLKLSNSTSFHLISYFEKRKFIKLFLIKKEHRCFMHNIKKQLILINEKKYANKSENLSLLSFSQ